MSAADLEALDAVEQAFNAAMISNDPAQIAACITDDWVLVTQERGPVPAQAVLAAIGSGVLTHDTTTKTTHHVHLMGDVATVTGRGQNTGTFHGEPISADEWITDVYRREGNTWRCVLTHLTPACSDDQRSTTGVSK